MTKKTTKKTATKSPYKFKKGDKVNPTFNSHNVSKKDVLIVTENYSVIPECKTPSGHLISIHESNLKLYIAPRTVLTIKTSKGCAKIIKTDEKQFHVQSKSGNNEIVQHSESLVAKQNAIENILATFDLYNSAEMRAWAKEVKRKMKGGKK